MSIFGGTGAGSFIDYPVYAVIVSFTDNPNVAFFVTNMTPNAGANGLPAPGGNAAGGCLDDTLGASLMAVIEDWAEGADWSSYGTYDSVLIRKYAETASNVTPA